MTEYAKVKATGGDWWRGHIVNGEHSRIGSVLAVPIRGDDAKRAVRRWVDAGHAEIVGPRPPWWRDAIDADTVRLRRHNYALTPDTYGREWDAPARTRTERATVQHEVTEHRAVVVGPTPSWLRPPTMPFVTPWPGERIPAQLR